MVFLLVLFLVAVRSHVWLKTFLQDLKNPDKQTKKQFQSTFKNEGYVIFTQEENQQRLLFGYVASLLTLAA